MPRFDLITNSDNSKPTREDIETLCLLHLIGWSHCTEAELTRRLGFADSLTPAVRAAIEPLVVRGWVVHDGDAMRRTAEGAEHLEARVAECGRAR